MPSPLDTAHAAMEADGGDDARLAFYARLAEVELHVPLLREAAGGTLDPQVFETGGGRFVLGFDRVERLGAFAGAPLPYAAVSGRALVAMLAAAGGLGLGVNLGVAPSSTLLGPEAVAWLAGILDRAPEEVAARPRDLGPPRDVAPALLKALDGKLASARGLARAAYLVAVTYDDGTDGHLLAVLEAVPDARGALAAAVNEAVALSGQAAGTLDVAFFGASDPMMPRLARVGLRFDVPQPARPDAPAAPGTDPARPPVLRPDRQGREGGG